MSHRTVIKKQKRLEQKQLLFRNEMVIEGVDITSVRHVASHLKDRKVQYTGTTTHRIFDVTGDLLIEIAYPALLMYND